MVFDPLEKSILATIIYFDRSDVFLNLSQLRHRLFRPRWVKVDEKLHITEHILERALHGLVDKGVVELFERGGDYYVLLHGRAGAFKEFLQKQPIVQKKNKKLRKFLKYFRRVPYIRAVFASGSLTLGNAQEESDLDTLVLTAPKRIWTARFLLSMYLSFLGVRRAKHHTDVRDKICLSHYITTEHVFGYKSIFTGQIFHCLTPLWEWQPGIARDFLKRHIWLEEYFVHQPSLSDVSAVGGSWLQRVGERMLNNRWGDKLEHFLRYLQLRRISADIKKRDRFGRIVATDAMLEFHPDSKEEAVIARYNAGLQEYGILNFEYEVPSRLEVVVK